MKNTMSKALWGVFFVLLGIALAGRAVGILNFNIYFPGWWTLFIIVPSAIGLANRENRTASIFGLGIGILLLASVQGLINWYTFPKLIISLIFIVIGSSFLFSKGRNNNERSQTEDYDSQDYGSDAYQDYGQYGRDYEENSDSRYDNYNGGGNWEQENGYNQSGNDSRENSYNQDYGYARGESKGRKRYNNYTAFLSGRNIQFVEEEFKGADVTSILGNVQLDLRNAILTDDVIIDTTCLLGGVDVYVPGNTKVILNCTPILGGIDNKVITPYNPDKDCHTIFIRGTCILGGIEVK